MIQKVLALIAGWERVVKVYGIKQLWRRTGLAPGRRECNSILVVFCL